MMTSLYEVLCRAAEMSALMGGQNIHSIYNNSQGFTTDLAECGLQKLNTLTNAVKVATESLKKHLADVGPNGTIDLLLYSQGGLIGYLALKQLTVEERAQISVYSFAPAKIIGPQGLAFSKNYVSLRDMVPFIADPIGCAKAAINKSEHVEFLPSNGIPLMDHAWDSETYSRAFADFASKHRDKWGDVK